MRRAAPAALFVLIVAVACGKVGDPKPPLVRTPEPIGDFRAVQSGYKVVLTWTNPGRYVDSNPATDLAAVHIRRNGVEIATVPVNAPGQPQSYEIDVTNSLNADLTFAVQVETQRKRVSPVSNATVRPVEVPGSPRGLKAIFDQYRITLTWEAPGRNPNLVAAFIVQRADRAGAAITQTTSFVDSAYEQDKTYTYTVTAARGSDGTIPGGAESVTVTATDTSPPATPVGLEIQPMGSDVFLKWSPNQEKDLKEYLIYRSDRTEPMHSQVDGFTDQDYTAGLSYQLVAVDFSDNRSERSAPQVGP